MYPHSFHNILKALPTDIRANVVSVGIGPIIDLVFDFALIFGPDVMLKNQGQFWALRLLTVRVRIAA